MSAVITPDKDVPFALQLETLTMKLICTASKMVFDERYFLSRSKNVIPEATSGPQKFQNLREHLTRTKTFIPKSSISLKTILAVV